MTGSERLARRLRPVSLWLVVACSGVAMAQTAAPPVARPASASAPAPASAAPAFAPDPAARPIPNPNAPVIEQVGRELVALLAELADAERDPGKRLDLLPVLRRASAATDALPQLRSAREARRLPLAQRREALAALLPQVTLSAGSGQRNSDSSGVSTRGSGSQTSLTGKQLLYDFGASSASLTAADRRIDSADQRFEVIRSEVLYRSLEVFYESQRALLQVRLARENLQARRSFVAYIVERAELGASSKADVVRAEARVAEALEQLAQALQRLTNAQSAYRQFYGAEAEPYVLPVEPVVEEFDPSNLTHLTARHPQVLEAEANLEAARAELASAKARLYGGLYFEVTQSETLDPGRPPTRGLSAMVVLRSDLYAGGSQEARIAQADIRVAQAQEDLARVRQELERNLREVIGEYAGQVAAVSARLLVFRASEESYSIAKDLYAFSRSSLFEVFKAQEDLYAAGQRLIDSLVDRAKSKMRLLHASQRLSGLVASAQATVRPSP